MFFEEFAVVVKESCDRVLGQDIVADLFLHEGNCLAMYSWNTDTKWHRRKIQKLK